MAYDFQCSRCGTNKFERNDSTQCNHCYQAGMFIDFNKENGEDIGEIAMELGKRYFELKRLVTIMNINFESIRRTLNRKID